MMTDTQQFNQITLLIPKLSPHYRLKLLEFIVKTLEPTYPPEPEAEKVSGVSFLLSIAGQGKSGEHDVSEL